MSKTKYAYTYIGSLPVVSTGKHINVYSRVNDDGKTVYYHHKNGKRETVDSRLLNAWLRNTH